LVVILGLLVLWGAVGAWWFLSRPDSHSTDSIGTFRQQLRVLERTGPSTVNPAYRMQQQGIGVYGASRVPTMSGPGRALAQGTTVAAARRRRIQKRRRDVFFALAASVAGSAVLGFLPGLSVMWGLSALLVVALALYVVVLLQLNAAVAEKSARAERARKVRYLPTAGPLQAEPAYLLRRAATN
jgi:hypothetical protein